jgi:hypothetical protein
MCVSVLALKGEKCWKKTDETERDVFLSGGTVEDREAGEKKCGNHCERLTVSFGW